MDIKELNQLIPADLKVKLKEFAARTASKFNGEPLAPAPPAPAPAPAATFGEGKLQDGTTVVKWNTPELGVGSVLTVVTPEGELAAPEGEHILEDGTKVVVEVKDGQAVVTAVEKAPAPESEMAQVISQVSGFSEQLKAFAKEKSEFAATVEAFKAEQEAQKAEFETMKSQFSEFVKLMTEVFNMPSSAPTEAPKNKHPKNKLFTLAD